MVPPWLKKVGHHNGARLKNPETTWLAASDFSVTPDMTQGEWEKYTWSDCFPRSQTGELIGISFRWELLVHNRSSNAST